MRHLASIKEVTNIRPIPQRDLIEQVMIDGWNVIVKKGEFKEGDLCVYVEIDSLMPQRPEFKFLEPKKYVIKTMKMAGVRSEGIAFPLSILPKRIKPVLGLDVTKALGITQYNVSKEDKVSLKDKIFAVFMRHAWFRNLFKKTIAKKKIKSTFPHWIRKTDETRIQNMPHVLDLGGVWIATEKVDGCSATYGLNADGMVICSRNHQLFDTDNVWAQVAEKYDLKRHLEQMLDWGATKNVVIQGEIIGPKIQGNKYKVDDLKFYVFNLIVDGVSISPHDVLADGVPFDLPLVPVVFDAIDLQGKTVEDVLKLAHFQSKLNPDTLAEGLVFRHYTPEGLKESFKAVNPLFLIHNQE